MSSKNFYGLTGDVTVDGGILNVGNAQLYANTETSNVGIGTPNPEFELDVRGDANVHNLYATYLHGDGSNIENIVSSQWEGSPGDPIYYTSNVGIANTSPVTKTLQVGSNLYVEDAGSNVIHVTGNVYADYFVGDGSQLTGIAASLDQIVDQGNTVSNTIQLVSGQDATSNVGLVTHEGVSISVSNANPTGEYQFGVGSNLLVNVYSSNVLTVGGNVFAQKMTLGSVTVTPAYNLQQITETGPTTTQTLVLSNVTTGLTADANVVVNGNVTAGSVITSGNVNAGNVVTSSNIEVGGDLSVTGNVYIDDMRVAEVASNLVTYDSTTGELMDSGGLFSNKLAVVSEPPPIALTGASTLVTNHGTYTIEASSGTVVNLFDKNDSTKWVTDGNYSTNVDTKGTYNGSASLAGHGGEWVKITMPYKTILRHIKIESTSESVEDIELVGLNADGLTWTPLKTETGLTGPTHTIIVNATTHHRTYGLIVEKTNTTTGRSAVEIGDLKLFTESFSIDGGKVEMATSAVMGGETTMDQHGPHSRDPKAVPLKKYPEIVFDASKLDGNDSTNTYTQAGYTVSASSQYPDRFGWEAFNDTTAEWLTADNTYATDGSYLAGGATFSSNGVDYTGNWLKIKLPNRVNIKKINITSYDKGTTSDDRRPKTGVFLGSNDDSSWEIIHRFNDDLTWNGASATGISTITNISNLNLYKYILLVVEEIQPNTVGKLTIREIEYYGYEEDPPTGDTSVDTTFTSIMNTPQTTGAQVYTDAKLSSDFTNRVTGPTVSNTHTTYVSAEKYWELSGNVESNVTVEANTFLQGDAPHSVSVWFNSSNLEANVSNTCVFSVSDQEKLDSVNLDLQSNTWHNLTYAYQGEGGSRVTYLDGRKVAEDQAEDTFGDYPPFAMTGYSQGGYVVSASQESSTFEVWRVFNDSSGFWLTGTGEYPSGVYDSSITGLYNLGTLTGGGSTDNGHYLKLELPRKLKISHVNMHARAGYEPQAPKNFKFYGSNDDTNWEQIGPSFSNEAPQDDGTSYYTLNSTKAYKYIGLVVTETVGDGNGRLGLQQLKLYGHRENDLVRLPDPTRVLKYPHIAMTGPAQRGYVASASSFYNSGTEPEHGFDGVLTSSGLNHTWESGPRTGSGNGRYTSGSTFNTSYLNEVPPLGEGGFQTTESSNTWTGEWLQIELPHSINTTKYVFGNANGNSQWNDRIPTSGVILGSTNGSTWK